MEAQTGAALPLTPEGTISSMHCEIEPSKLRSGTGNHSCIDDVTIKPTE